MSAAIQGYIGGKYVSFNTIEEYNAYVAGQKASSVQETNTGGGRLHQDIISRASRVTDKTESEVQQKIVTASKSKSSGSNVSKSVVYATKAPPRLHQDIISRASRVTGKPEAEIQSKIQPKQTSWKPQELGTLGMSIRQQTQTQLSSLQTSYRDIEPMEQYYIPGFLRDKYRDQETIYGWRLREELLPFIESAKQQDIQAQKLYYRFMRGAKEWHPETRVRKTDTGYVIDFPFAGAEQYKSLRKEALSPGGAFASALTGTDPLGLTSAYYIGTGERERAIETKVKALYTARHQHPIEFYISMPTTQIGLAAAGSAGITAAGPYISGLGIGTGIGGSIAKGVGVVAVGGLVGYETYNIGKEYIQGRPGEAFGKAGVLGLTIASGYAGYRSVTPTEKALLHSKGLARWEAKHLHEIRMYYGREGVPVLQKTQSLKPKIERTMLSGTKTTTPDEYVTTMTQGKGFISRGTPIEKTMLEVHQSTMYKPSRWSIKNLESGIKIEPPSYIATTRQPGPSFEIGTYLSGERGKSLVNLAYYKGQTGSRGLFFKRIRSVRGWKVNIFEKKTITEAVGFGGIAKTVSIPATMNVLPVDTVPVGFTSISNVGLVPVTIPFSQTKIASKKIVSIPNVENYLKPVFIYEQDSLSGPITTNVGETKVERDRIVFPGSQLEYGYSLSFIQQQVQEQTQKLEQETEKIKIGLTLVTPSFKVSKPIVPFDFRWNMPGGGVGKGRAKLGMYRGTGYRFRSWKVPSLEQFLKNWR